MRINRKAVLYSFLSVVLLTLVFAGLFRVQIRQFYHTVRLFDEDVIVANFSNMGSIAPTITIKRSGQVTPFGHQPQALPESFVYKNESRSMAEFLKDSSTTALLVIKGNDIVFEEYYQGTGEYDQRISWSMAKSFLSAIFGVAVNDGLIPDLNQAVTDYVPELKGSGYDGVSIKNVLQMSTGVYFNEDYGDFHSDINRMGRLMALGGSFDDFAASLTREREQGTYMHYVSINTHVLGMVLRAATGRSIADYFDEKLWSRLDTERDAIYISDSTGEPMVLGGLNLITRDYARFGRLYRDRGIIDGEQIIPANWIEDSITPDAPHLMPGVRDNSDTDLGYGYQWWLPQHADGEFMAIGIYGQYIYVNRKADVVIVKNSAHRGFMDNHYESEDITVAAFRAIAREISIN
jgi:CubicO group peptidase (beta-lactamase class C family)